MNVNKTKPATSADYKRIIETNLNINAPRVPSLIKYSDIYSAVNDQNFMNRVPLYNPTANDYAQTHKILSDVRKNSLSLFLKEQYRIDEKRTKYRKVKTSYNGDYLMLTIKDQKNFGHQVAKVIHDANKPPQNVEQDRKMIDYTLRACEYLKRLESMSRADVINRLEPNLKHIQEQFNNGDWDRIHWYELGMDTPIVDNLNYLFKLHRVHASLKSPHQIAHYPTLRHLRDRREVITKLGKYLTTFKDFIGLNESEIKNYVEKYNAIIASRTGWQVNFIESNDADGFVNVYMKAKVRSCMTYDNDDIKNALRTYAHDKSVLRLAYLTNGANEIIARCIVREDLKQYVRIYPDANGATEGRYLQDYLKANGYTHGNLDGCLLRAEPHEDDEDIYRAPYIDAGIQGNGAENSAQSGTLMEIDGTYYIEINTDGDLCLANTGGYTEDIENDDDYSTCEDCGDRVHNDDTTYTWHDQYVCNHCIENRYSYAYVERKREEYVHHDNIIEVKGVYYWDEADLSDFDIYYCEASDEYHHIDDLVMTFMGLIHQDYAQPLDHEDADGNNYAHMDDAHELSDGTWCHKDDAEELQAEIDAEDEDDTQPTQEQTQNENI